MTILVLTLFFVVVAAVVCLFVVVVFADIGTFKVFSVLYTAG